MNIKDFTKNTQNDNNVPHYSSSMRRSLASGIDMFLVLVIRSIFIQLAAIFHLNKVREQFAADLYQKFGTYTAKGTPEHVNFLIHHQFFSLTVIYLALTVLVGALYYAFLNSSSWQGTVGKRAMGIIMVKEPYQSKISFNLALKHYFLSVLPFIYVIYLLAYILKNNVTLFDAITTNNSNLVLGIIFIAWIQTHLFTRKKTTAYDWICKTVSIDSKTNAKFPWSRT